MSARVGGLRNLGLGYFVLIYRLNQRAPQIRNHRCADDFWLLEELGDESRISAHVKNGVQISKIEFRRFLSLLRHAGDETLDASGRLLRNLGSELRKYVQRPRTTMESLLKFGVYLRRHDSICKITFDLVQDAFTPIGGTPART